MGPAPAVCFLHRQEMVSENGLCLKSTREEPPSLSRCQTTRGHLRARCVHPPGQPRGHALSLTDSMLVLEAASRWKAMSVPLPTPGTSLAGLLL